ncbi:MAG: endonuclease/exonuclease/phosphatase family protein [Myxococcota bacterium]
MAALVATLSVVQCDVPVRIATFNIRMFPTPKTDPAAVARAIASVDADVLGVQEIKSAGALAAVLAEASERTGRDYRSALSNCRHPRYGITTGLVWDAARWDLVELRHFPQLSPDGAGTCGRSQPGLAGVFESDGSRIVVLSVHLDAHPRGYPARREQWTRVIAIQKQLRAEFDAEVLALGDFNSTGFTSEPAEEPDYVRDVVGRAGFELLSDDLECTEYYRPGEAPNYLPSLLDHLVATGGDWDDVTVHGLCARLRCTVTAPEDMDPEFFAVSDHCPVVVEGSI